MASPSWQVSGQYYETCSCDFVCPCVPGQMAVRPSKGSCTFAMAFQVERGSFGHVSPRRPRVHRARADAGGDGEGQLVGRRHRRRAGHCRAARRPHRHCQRRRGRADVGVVGPGGAVRRRRVRANSVPTRRRQVVRQGVESGRHGGCRRHGHQSQATEPLHLDNTGHPAADRFALARASRSHVHALGFSWDDVSGLNNGQYAPFSWRSA